MATLQNVRRQSIRFKPAMVTAPKKWFCHFVLFSFSTWISFMYMYCSQNYLATGNNTRSMRWKSLPPFHPCISSASPRRVLHYYNLGIIQETRPMTISTNKSVISFAWEQL
jgi:hypothetical protein